MIPLSMESREHLHVLAYRLIWPLQRQNVCPPASSQPHDEHVVCSFRGTYAENNSLYYALQSTFVDDANKLINLPVMLTVSFLRHCRSMDFSHFELSQTSSSLNAAGLCHLFSHFALRKTAHEWSLQQENNDYTARGERMEHCAPSP